ncbi:MAG: glutamate--cysteine ligase [Planctomycetes bacterium]|nr:glutamate--cysteine ligase [Planctomycetota bacterium]
MEAERSSDSDGSPFGWFEAIGIELEYMIVDATSLDVRPICDRLMEAEAGKIVADVEFDDVSWSNELTAHVVELKTTTPPPRLEGWADHFDAHLRRIRNHLQPLGARLMPGAMHPWMDPGTEMKLWPHDYRPIYEAMHRVFDCRGHGWANLQSLHINLPFRGDEEFGRLHAAIRAVLPILPALAASSPAQDGVLTGRLDQRLMNYRHHCDRLRSMVADVVPEPVFSIDEYHERVLGWIYRELEPLDPEGLLRHEFANARGAIARFERSAIEIRVIDVQECPRADLAIAALATSVVRALGEEAWGRLDDLKTLGTEPLVAIFDACIADADEAVIADRDYLDALGIPGSTSMTAGEVWRQLRRSVERYRSDDLSAFASDLDLLFDHGPLARRLREALGDRPDRSRFASVYTELCDALDRGELFRVPSSHG